MFGWLKRKEFNETPMKAKFMLIEKETETLFGYFQSHNDVLDKKIELEIRSKKHFKVVEV